MHGVTNQLQPYCSDHQHASHNFLHYINSSRHGIGRIAFIRQCGDSTGGFIRARRRPLLDAMRPSSRALTAFARTRGIGAYKPVGAAAMITMNAVPLVDARTSTAARRLPISITGVACILGWIGVRTEFALLAVTVFLVLKYPLIVMPIRFETR